MGAFLELELIQIIARAYTEVTTGTFKADTPSAQDRRKGLTLAS